MGNSKLSIAEFVPATAGKLGRQKSGKLRTGQAMKEFADALGKAGEPQASERNQKDAGTAHMLMQALKLREAGHAKTALRNAGMKDIETADLAADAVQLAAFEVKEEETDSGDEALPSSEAGEQPHRSEAAVARLSLLFGAILPGRQNQSDELARPEQDGATATEDARQPPAALKLQPANDKAGASLAGHTPDDVPDVASKPSSLLAAPAAEPVVKIHAASHRELGNLQEPAPRELPPVVLTKVETVLMPAGMTLNAAAQKTAAADTVQAPVPALPMAGAENVVRSIEFRLQPENLGDVRVALHLRGEELRISVQVTTHEAHALLQRDHKALRDVLEKAGYDVSETAVAVSLRIEPPAAQQSGSLSQDPAAQQRGGETHQHFAGGQQSRQPARQPFKEEDNAQAGCSPSRDGGRSHPAGNIYL